MGSLSLLFNNYCSRHLKSKRTYLIHFYSHNLWNIHGFVGFCEKSVHTGTSRVTNRCVHTLSVAAPRYTTSVSVTKVSIEILCEYDANCFRIHKSCQSGLGTHRSVLHVLWQEHLWQALDACLTLRWTWLNLVPPWTRLFLFFFLPHSCSCHVTVDRQTDCTRILRCFTS